MKMLIELFFLIALCFFICCSGVLMYAIHTEKSERPPPPVPEGCEASRWPEREPIKVVPKESWKKHNHY